MKPVVVAQQRIFAGRADCYVLDDGRRVLAAVEPSSDEAFGALYRAWSLAMNEHSLELHVGRARVRCVEIKRVVRTLDALCWGQPPGAPHQRGAECMRRAMADAVEPNFAELPAVWRRVMQLPHVALVELRDRLTRFLEVGA